METKSVRVTGIQTPAYLNGRSRAMLIESFRPTSASPIAAVAPVTASVTAVTVAPELQKVGVLPGQGLPFAAMYMTRANKKVAALRSAA